MTKEDEMKEIEEIIFHIGMHKTGSSAIQTSLQNLNNMNSAYANLGQPNHSICLYTIFCDEPSRYEIHIRLGRTPTDIETIRISYLKKLEDLLENIKTKQLIFSGEAISLLSEDGVRRLFNYFSQFTKQQKIIGYVRDPIGFRNSMVQQRAKGGIARYIQQDPNYRFRFEKFFTIFGKSNIELRLYDQNLFPEGSVVKDFCKEIKIEDPPTCDIASNERLPLEATKLLMIFNRHGTLSFGDPRLIHARNKLINWLSCNFETPFTLPKDVLYKDLDMADIEWMESILDSSLLDRSTSTHILEEASIDDIFSIDPLSKTAEKLKTMAVNLGIYSQANALQDIRSKLGVDHEVNSGLVNILNLAFYHFLFENMLNDSHTTKLAEIALKLESSPDFILNDALFIMQLADKARPENKYIKSKISSYLLRATTKNA
jgi:hypothetical protein